MANTPVPNIPNQGGYQTTTEKFFGYTNENPDAQIILNRGTNFQQDISDDVMSFSTSAAIDDVIGSFNVVLNNQNDKYFDRYAQSKISKMSSIEIFLKTSTANIIANQNSAANSLQTITVSEKTAPSPAGPDKNGITANVTVPTSLNDIVDQYYGKDLPKSQRDYYAAQIIYLNETRVVTSGSTTTTVPYLSNTNTVLKPGDKLKIPPINNNYLRVFWGVIVNVGQNIAPGGVLTLTLSGKSLGYWLESSVVNLNPSAGIDYNAATSQPESVYANKYANTTALDIFKDLVSLSTSDLVVATDFSLETDSSSLDYLQIAGASAGQTLSDGHGGVFLQSDQKTPLTGTTATQYINSIYAYQNTSQTPLPLYSKKFNNTMSSEDITGWKKVSLQYVQTQQSINNLKASISNAASVIPQTPDAAKKLQDLQSQLNTANTTLTNIQGQFGGTVTPTNVPTTVIAQIKILQNDVQTLTLAGQKNVLNNLGIIQHWQQIFNNITLEILNNNFLSLVHPFQWEVATPSLLDGDYENKASIGQTVAQNLMYEFYVDTNGYFVVKPPFFNISATIDDKNYIVKDDDIYSMNLNDTCDGIITRMDVSGGYYENSSMPKDALRDQYQDFNLMKMFGFHSKEVTNLLFLRSIADCRAFARAYMSKLNSELVNGTITIYGRPEVRLGTCLYLQSKDTVYYITGVSHDFTAGEGSTTTLTLVAGRRIIRGFPATKTVTQYWEVLNPDGTYSLSLTNPNGQTGISYQTSSNDILYYVQLNATNFSYLDLSPDANQNAQLNQTLNANNNNMISSKISSDIVQILNNKYIITSHPNIVLIGLIVDENSQLIRQINLNYYFTLSNLNTYAQNALSPNASTATLGISSASIVPAALELQVRFNVFVGIPNTGKIPKSLNAQGSSFFQIYGFNKSDCINTTAISSPNNPQAGSNFTYSKMNLFITSQYQRISNTIATNNTKTFNSSQYNNFNVQTAILNALVKDSDALGSYNQYTDDYGRELPSYVDFGKSLIVEQATVAINNGLYNLQHQKNTNPNTVMGHNNHVKTSNAAIGQRSNQNQVPNPASVVVTNLSQSTSPSFGVLAPSNS